MQIEEKHFARDASQPESIAANLTVVEEGTASAEVLGLYREFRSRFGRPDLPGIVKCFATSPAVLKSMIDLANGFLFVEGHLTRRDKEMVATFVSSQNGCLYCADSHGNSLLAQGGSEELLSALRTGALNSAWVMARERALLRFALKVNGESPSITRADVEETMQAGWTEEQITETVHLTALFAAFNRIANAFGLPSPNHRL